MIIKRFAFWNPGTWNIPSLYWDAFSDEQRIHAICKQLGKVIAYADYLGVNVDDIAERLKAIEEGQITPIIVAAVEEWFEEHQEQIFGAITDLQEALPISQFDAENTVKDYIDDVDDKLGSGFDAENTVKDYIDDVDDKLGSGFDAENTVKDAIDGLEEQIYRNIRDVSWNCVFRQIGASNENLSYVASCQGMCIFELNGDKYFAQSILEDTTATIIIYSFDTNAEVDRISGAYGHLNDMTYKDNILYALAEADQILYKFNITASTITFNSSESIPIRVNGIHLNDDGTWYTAMGWGKGHDIEVKRYSADFLTEIESYGIPFQGNAIVQGLSIVNNDMFIALTAPNTLVYFNKDTEYYYFISTPRYIGHCFVDEVEGVHIDSDYNVYFNTNSCVDLQLMVSLFQTNLIHNIEKEVDSSILQNRYNFITANIDYVNGNLVAPGEVHQTFKLVGDAITYAKALGCERINISFDDDYPLCIVANSMNINFQTTNADDIITLNGFYLNNCEVSVAYPAKLKLNPSTSPSLYIDGVYYGGACLQCRFALPFGTWATPDTAYDTTHKKIYFRNSVALLQEANYYRFYNSLVNYAGTGLPSTTIYERTGVVTHIT